MIRIALTRRKVVYVGEGANIWSNIHIRDLVTLYLAVIKHALAQHGSAYKVDAYNNYYFAESGEKSIKGIAELIAPVLYKKGEYFHVRVSDRLFTFFMIGTQALLTAPRLRASPWRKKPD